MAQTNSTILAKAWLEGTNDFQQRIPEPTQGSIDQTIKALFDPMNRQFFNQFMDQLINRIGFTYVRGKTFENPLAVFKDGKLNYGSTIQEIAPKWIKAHSYQDDSETLLKLERPEAAVWYHSLNRQDRYAISVTREELQMAFTSETGLNELVARIMELPRNSDNYDEFLIMKQLIAEYEAHLGFYKHQLSAVPTNEATGKELLTAIRTYVGKLQFPSTLYNALDVTDIPVFAKPNELVLFVTPETDASLDVNTLAQLFNLDKAEVQVRKVIIDEFPIANAVALLTTEDFFVCKDSVYETTSFYNPETLSNKYYLQHWGVYSVSPFVPAILFTTEEGTDTESITQSVTGLNLTADPATAEPGDVVQLKPALQGNVTDDVIEVAPDSCTYTVSAASAASEGTPIQLNSRTYVDRNARLHIQKSGLAAGNVITVTATSTYYNPSGTPTPQTATATVTIK